MDISKVKKIVNFRNGYVAEFEFVLCESGAFQYGNKTSVVMRDKNAKNGFLAEERFDTRYDTTLKADGSNFDEWVNDFIAYRFEGLVV